VIVDCAVYERGVRVAAKPDITGVRSHGHGDDAFVWVGLVEPTVEEFERVRAEFDLHELAVEDALKAHQRPKLENYGDSLFVVLKTATYEDPEELVEAGEVMIFVGKDFVVSVRHGPAGGLGNAREDIEQRPELLRHGPSAALWALIDRVVDGYQPVAAGLANDIEEVEAAVFAGDRSNPVERIYRLRREVLLFHRAVDPLGDVLAALVSEPLVAEPIRDYLRDVADHVARLADHIDNARDLLTSILQANLTQVSVRQNEDMRKISAWVAIIAVPTMIAGIYGMNFEHMPELEWRFGYPAVLLVIAAACGYLYVRFRRSGWL
jgi:magnesium transporter